MQTCMKPERQPLTGLSIAYKSIDLIHISNSSCLDPKETEFPQSPKKIYIFEFLGHTNFWVTNVRLSRFFRVSRLQVYDDNNDVSAQNAFKTIQHYILHLSNKSLLHKFSLIMITSILCVFFSVYIKSSATTFLQFSYNLI
jgi:hypothetical protein